MRFALLALYATIASAVKLETHSADLDLEDNPVHNGMAMAMCMRVRNDEQLCREINGLTDDGED